MATEPTQEELMRIYEANERRKEKNRVNQRAFKKNKETDRKIDKIRLGNLIEDEMREKNKKLKKRLEMLESVITEGMKRVTVLEEHDVQNEHAINEIIKNLGFNKHEWR